MNNKMFIIYIKYILEILASNILKIFWVFPLKKNNVVFMSFSGEQYSDSPLAISNRLFLLKPNIKQIWILNDVNVVTPHFITKIKKNTIRYFQIVCTAKIIVVNDSIDGWMPIRKNQIVLNTWHGGSPTKTVGFMESHPDPYYKYYFNLQETKTSAILSSSNFFTQEVIKKSFGFKNTEILEFGLPRNDILFQDHSNIRKKVYNYFSLKESDESGLILYAPTFRGSTSDGAFIPAVDRFSINEVIECLNKKFHKKFYFLFRAHHAMKGINMSGAISATEYPDMQDLLCAADILITDYSSCMHDFSLMKKPVFLFIPDYYEYMKDRGFYYEIPSMPFRYALNQEELKKTIKKFSQDDYEQGVTEYLNRMGNIDDGHATDRTIKWLEEQWTKK